MADAKKELISIVVPVFNEERNIRSAYNAIVQVFAGPAEQYDFEIIFTDNHSTDGTYSELVTLASDDSRVKVLRFARNFGFQRSVLTGYRAATGDAAIQMDCDLQDPPELFVEFLYEWKKGHDVVVGLRRERQEPALLTMFRKLFYRLVEQISDEGITRDAGDFRLLDRRVLDRLKRIHDANPYMRGLISSLAARQTGIAYDRRTRLHEQSKFPFLKLIVFAVDGIIGHSILPLRLATFIGIFISVITFILSGFYIVGNFVFGANWPAGFATTTVLILFGISLNGIFLGILGEYVGRIYRQVLSRPTTIIESSINIDASRLEAQ